MDKDTLLSSFGKWVAPINSEILQDWKDTTALDRYTKKLTTSIFLLLFVEAQLQRRKGLRSIMRELQADEEFQQVLGITSISAAQLSRKNNQLDPEVLQSILCDLITRLHRGQSPSAQAAGPVKIIDSTTISLCLNTYKWATFRKTKAGVKLQRTKKHHARASSRRGISTGARYHFDQRGTAIAQEQPVGPGSAAIHLM